jgi:adenosylmethionine-8-amino-7-oxononanoate aminotransferase
MFFHTTHPAVVELSERLFSLLPGSYSHVIYTNSGSEANEVLIRTVRRFWDVMGQPDKKIFIGRQNGYHGSTVGSASLGGMAFMHEMGNLPIPGLSTLTSQTGIAMAAASARRNSACSAPVHWSRKSCNWARTRWRLLSPNRSRVPVA